MIKFLFKSLILVLIPVTSFAGPAIRMVANQTSPTFSGDVTVAGDLYVNGNTTLGDASTDWILMIGSVAVQNPLFSVGGSTFVVRNGRVGLGITNPLAQFHINQQGTSGGIRISTWTGAITGYYNQYYDGSDWLFNSGAFDFVFKPGGTQLLKLDNAAQDIVTFGPGSGGDIDVQFLTAGATVFIQGSDGFVGLGMINPDVQLDVTGNSEFTGNVDMNEYDRHLGDANTYRRWEPDSCLYHIGSADMIKMVELATGSTIFFGGNGWDIDYVFRTAGSTSVIQGSNGYVGISTRAPAEVLSVGGNGLFTGWVQGSTFNAVGTAYQMNGVTWYDSNGDLSVARDGSIAGDDFTVGVTTLVINAGLVGIGTSSPNEQLELAGNFRMVKTDTTTVTGIIYAGADIFIHNHTLAGSARYNTFLGIGAGNLTMTGFGNVGIGPGAGEDLTGGKGNVLIGDEAGIDMTSGQYNVCIGRRSCYILSGTIGNVGLGQYALRNTNANYNVAVGDTAGDLNTSGTYNSYLGYNANALANNYTNSTAIGANARVDGSNMIVLGDTDTLVGVGIGIGAPTTMLDVIGTVRLSSSTNPTAGGLYLDADNQIGIGVADADVALHIISSGTAGQLAIERSTTYQSNGIRFLDEIGDAQAHIRIRGIAGNDLQLIAAVNQDIRFYTESNLAQDPSGERMVILNSGNVGIGTTGPSESLDVVGNGLFTGSVTASTFNVSGSEYQVDGIKVIDGSRNVFAASLRVSTSVDCSALTPDSLGQVCTEDDPNHPFWISIGTTLGDFTAAELHRTNDSEGLGEMYISSGNVTATVISVSSQMYPVAGTVLAGPDNHNFSVSGGSLTYTGISTHTFFFNAILSVKHPVKDKALSITFGKNGVPLVGTWHTFTISKENLGHSAGTSKFISLTTGDSVNVNICNRTGTSDPTVVSMTVVAFQVD